MSMNKDLRDSEIIRLYPEVFESLQDKNTDWIITYYMRLYHISKVQQRQLHKQGAEYNKRKKTYDETQELMNSLKDSVNKLTSENSKIKRKLKRKQNKL